MRSAAVAQAEMAGGQAQGCAGKHEARPGTGVAGPENGLDAMTAINRPLRLDKPCVSWRAGRVIAARHADFDISVTTLGQVPLQRGQGVLRSHVRDQPQIELCHGLVWKYGFAPRTGVTANQSFDV